MAAENKNVEFLKYLAKVGGKELVLKPDEVGHTYVCDVLVFVAGNRYIYTYTKAFV
jgi:hypothetical protein